MKKIIYSLMLGSAALLTTACADFTEIQPKGENLLSTTDDLALLLNSDTYDGVSSMNTRRVGANIIYAYSDVSVPLTVDNKSTAAIYNGYFDDQENLTRLAVQANTDGQYTSCYNIIGRVSNPILKQLDMASGPEATKNALKAEALVARAFCHFMVFQRFAAAYNGSNGDDAAIIYMKEDMDIMEQHPKNTIQECYDNMLQDVNDALALNALPDKAPNFMRWDKKAALALKAHILMGMRNYTEAEATAKQVLGITNTLFDYYANVEEAHGMLGNTYFVVPIDDRNNPETLFMIPDMNYYSWVAPSEWDWMEEEYGRRGTSDVMSKQYAGFIYQGRDYSDYGASIGLPGWNAAMDFDHYQNKAGLSVPQMYLFIAECELRSGNIGTAMNWLDQLRAKRLPEGFEKLEGTVTTKADAIEWLKKTVAAEYLWTDWTYYTRKRWNVESEWATTLSHTIGGKTYTLRPDSKLWIFPFPVNATEKNTNLTNNW